MNKSQALLELIPKEYEPQPILEQYVVVGSNDSCVFFSLICSTSQAHRLDKIKIQLRQRMKVLDTFVVDLDNVTSRTYGIGYSQKYGTATAFNDQTGEWENLSLSRQEELQSILDHFLKFVSEDGDKDATS